MGKAIRLGAMREFNAEGLNGDTALRQRLFASYSTRKPACCATPSAGPLQAAR